ncbi:hypothetical protein Tco_0126493 [Tanacetum coccineum]
MVLMVPYEAFACPCGAGDVVLRESYKPKTRGKLYYACPRSKPRQNIFRCEFFLWKKERCPSTGSSSTSRNAECSNCKHLLGKITVHEATVEMYMHPKQHTLNSAALLHEVYNDMGKLGLE